MLVITCQLFTGKSYPLNYAFFWLFRGLNLIRQNRKLLQKKIKEKKPVFNLTSKVMKRVLFAGLLMLAFSAASFSKPTVASGKTYTRLGDYRIEMTDPTVINSTECKTYLISYENSPMQVKVVVMKGKKCKDFVVVSDKLAVKYVCNKNYFGVERLTKPFDGITTSDATLNRSEYFHQKVIAPGMRGELENAQLIAAYFPLLINQDLLATI